MRKFSGKVLFLDRSDINTDEIIPAKYLTENSKEALKPFLLEDLKLNDFDPEKDLENVSVVITRSNFGCGSSREHAPWAFSENGINLIIAESYARIFRQNMYNNGMMALELPEEKINDIFNKYQTQEAEVEIDLESMELMIKNKDGKEIIPFKISDFDMELIQAGGWVDFADRKY